MADEAHPLENTWVYYEHKKMVRSPPSSSLGGFLPRRGRRVWRRAVPRSATRALRDGRIHMPLPLCCAVAHALAFLRFAPLGSGEVRVQRARGVRDGRGLLAVEHPRAEAEVRCGGRGGCAARIQIICTLTPLLTSLLCSQIFTNSGERKTIKYEGEGWHQIEALSVFKKVGGRKVDPAWEDPLNAAGGEFRVADIGTPKEMDKMWRTLLMSLVGETLDPENTITGVRVVDKCRGSSNQYRFEVWTSTKFESAPAVKKAIENELQRVLEVRTVKWANH
jgi:hypothetical protein